MPKFHVVIHVRDNHQACEQVGIATQNGADGVWLIDHRRPWFQLWKTFQVVRMSYPSLQMGINFLDLDPEEVFQLPIDLHSINGVWADNAQIYEGNVLHHEAEKVWRAKYQSGWKGAYYGGVAFKGQRRVHDVAEVAAAAIPYMDVITTSGNGTGIAASLEKIRMMKEAVGDHPVALASGVTSDNVEDYLPYVDVFMVASGISKDFHTLDPEKVARLAEVIRRA